mmetsp:Transcript_74627/g.207441  ORF Transcript_74627/g.207441 Transcript_74627/m.207441 type:complete len:262 (-) Transcript_74627:125-910(-)
MMEMKLTTRKSVNFYSKAAAGFLRGAEDTPPVRELRILALGSAIPIAAGVASRIATDGLGKIVRASTACVPLEGGKVADGLAQLSIDIKSCEPWFEHVIFLDVDGVLHPAFEGDDMFLPSCMQRLCEIVKGSSASIVLSSSWREREKTIRMVNDELHKAGLEPVVDVTPVSRFGTVDNFQSRSDEILDWLSRHRSVKHFVALDDANLTDPHGEAFGKHFVQTDAGTGLTEHDVSRALQVMQLTVDRSSLPVALRISDGPDA